MDFSRVLNQSFLENAPKQSDPTKEILDQGKNFMKTMAGERGIMAAIEGAHLRPVISKYIKSKLNSVTTSDVKQAARTMATRMGRAAPEGIQPGVGGTVSQGPRGELPGPAVNPLATENLVMAPKPSDTGLVEEGGFQSLAPGRGISDRFETPTASIGASRLTSGIDATNNPLSPSNIENVGQSSAVPKLDTPENLPGLPGSAAVTKEALAESDRNSTPEALAARSAARAEAATQSRFQEALTSLPSAKPVQTVKVLPTKEDLAAAGATRANELVRTTPKPTPEPSVPSASTPAAAPEIGPLGSVNNPYMADQGPKATPAPEPSQINDFPTPPSSIPPPARGETDEELAQRLSNLKEGSGVEEEVEATTRSLGSIARSGIGAAGTGLEIAGVAQALGERGLTGNQRAGDIGQTLGPRAIQTVANKAGQAYDEFGLPSTFNVATDVTAPAAAGGAAGAAGAAGAGGAAETEAAAAAAAAAKAAAGAGIKTEAETAAEAAAKAAAGAAEGGTVAAESSVPGIGTILAIGTALYGAIRGGVEAGKAKKAAEDYITPQSAKVAMDNAVSFDSSFR